VFFRGLESVKSPCDLPIAINFSSQNQKRSNRVLEERKTAKTGQGFPRYAGKCIRQPLQGIHHG
jgi:hypothetical protein